MKKKEATPKSSPNLTNQYCSSVEQQRGRVLKALRESGSRGLSTIQLREDFDVMAPAPRIFELRHALRYNIRLIWDRERNAQGNVHTCGRYILFPGSWSENAS